MNSISRPALRLIVMGAPGAGKGTQCQWLMRDFPQIQPISTGDLLRSHMLQQSEIGKRAQEAVNQGRLVDDQLVNELIQYELKRRTKKDLLLDGYPRTLAQAKYLDQFAHLSAVVNLDVPEDVILKRVLNRWVHAPSGRTYHLTFSPPIVPGRDDITGEPLSQRPDDTESTVRTRLKAYSTATRPLLSYYATKGLLHNFSGSTSETIYPELKKLIESLLKSQMES